MEKKRFFTPLRVGLLGLGLLGLAGQLYLSNLQRQGLRFLWQIPYILCPCVALLCGLLLLYQGIRRRVQGGWKRSLSSLVLSLLMLAVLAAGCVAWMLTQVWGRNVPQVHESPDGRYRLVTLDTGFMDAALTAYPMVDRWTYRKQDNGFLSYHELGAVRSIGIDWGEGEALVTMQSFGAYPNEGSNLEGYIRVVFGETAQ